MQGRDDLSLNDSDIETWLASVTAEPVVPEVNVVAPANIVPMEVSLALASSQAQFQDSTGIKEEESIQSLKSKHKRKREDRDVFVDSITCEALPNDEEPIKVGRFYYYKDKWVVSKCAILKRKYRFEDDKTLLTLKQKQSFAYDHTKKALCFEGRKVYWTGKYKPKNTPLSAVQEDVSVRPQIQDVELEVLPTQQGKGVSYKNNIFTLFRAENEPPQEHIALKCPYDEYRKGGKCPRK